MAKMIAIRDCFVYNKRFKKGDEFPAKWIAEGYLPNHHFLPENEAKAFLKESSFNKPIQCAGDDPRSNEELRKALLKHTNINSKWTRKELWLKLREYETSEARTESKAKPK